jgi:hypothetical protein
VHRTRDWLAGVADDPELADESVPRPRTPVRRSFHDKLAPAERCRDAASPPRRTLA